MHVYAKTKSNNKRMTKKKFFITTTVARTLFFLLANQGCGMSDLMSALLLPKEKNSKPLQSKKVYDISICPCIGRLVCCQISHVYLGLFGCF